MAFVRVHALARRQRRRLVVLAVMLFLGAAVAVAHSAVADGHMGDGSAMCLAIVGMGAAGIVAGLGHVALGSFRPDVVVAVPVRPSAAVLAVQVLPRTRAGPAALQVFLR